MEQTHTLQLLLKILIVLNFGSGAILGWFAVVSSTEQINAPTQTVISRCLCSIVLMLMALGIKHLFT